MSAAIRCPWFVASIALTVSAVALHATTGSIDAWFGARFGLVILSLIAIARLKNHRVPWSLIALAQLFTVFGSLLTIQQGRVDDPPLAGSLMFVFGYFSAFGAVITITRAQRMNLKLEHLADGITVAITVFVLKWAFFIGPVVETHGWSLGVSPYIYPVADAVLIAAVTPLLRFEVSFRRAEPFLVSGLFVTSAADSWTSWLLLEGTYGPRSVSNSILLAGYGLLAIGATHPHANRLRLNPSEMAVFNRRRALGLAVVALVTPTCALVVYSTADRTTMTGLLVGTILIFAFVLVRLSTAARLIRDGHERLYREANYDALTGARRRAPFMRVAERALHEHELEGQAEQPIAIWFDVDDFKQLNDRHGHQVGDCVLQEIVNRILAALDQRHIANRCDAILGRTGGDEFTAILNPTSGRPLSDDELGALADVLVAAIAVPTDVGDGLMVAPSVTMGIARSEPGDSVVAWLGRADAAMYVAKRNNKGGWHLGGGPATLNIVS